MRFQLPKPLHGWREFAGEVGIIVIGVLIALGAEQLLSDWHWRNEVHETDRRLRAEMALDLSNAYERFAIDPSQANEDSMITTLEAARKDALDNNAYIKW